MIFEPVNPVFVGCCGCGITLHGRFLRRQKEVSKKFAEVNTKQILHSEHMWDQILHGPKKDNFQFMLGKHTHQVSHAMIYHDLQLLDYAHLLMD
jgi:hypothetical protein